MSFAKITMLAIAVATLCVGHTYAMFNIMRNHRKKAPATSQKITKAEYDALNAEVSEPKPSEPKDACEEQLKREVSWYLSPILGGKWGELGKYDSGKDPNRSEPVCVWNNKRDHPDKEKGWAWHRKDEQKSTEYIYEKKKSMAKEEEEERVYEAEKKKEKAEQKKKDMAASKAAAEQTCKDGRLKMEGEECTVPTGFFKKNPCCNNAKEKAQYDRNNVWFDLECYETKDQKGKGKCEKKKSLAAKASSGLNSFLTGAKDSVVSYAQKVKAKAAAKATTTESSETALRGTLRGNP